MRKLLFFWDELKSTFWFVPVLIMTGTIAIAFFSVWLDSQISLSREGVGRYLFIGSIDSARSILATVSGAMIGVAGTVFSITLVALTLASSQFGPRLIRNFMYERLNQVVLGSYVSTYIYCLLILNSIKETDNVLFIPSISILLALLAAVANIVLLIIFIHHIAISIQADHVISDISNSLSTSLKLLFPEFIGEESEETKSPDVKTAKSFYEFNHPIRSKKSGYLQYIDSEALIKFAKENELLIELNYRPGDYLVENMDIGVLHTNSTVEEEDIKKVLSQFIIGNTRTHQQDVEHTINQMVEIAARALSTGVNDPYTAIACIDNLSSSLCYMTKVKFPSKYRLDNDGQLRVIADVLSFEGMLDAAYNQIRQFAKRSPSVVIRLMEALTTIDKIAKNPSHKEALRKHATMVLNMAESAFDEPNDVEDLKMRSKLLNLS
jgi:uncharacterized membrane protein